ncbi:low temperature requirement protein A [Micromonospora coerulea]|uniref:low temperature requirement protein A n=1 Tax=Micromonospora coerulea TaxID=47856 RepID=UPI001905332C|nr:low temperature requirement protein A [Micromonospora veneta]
MGEPDGERLVRKEARWQRASFLELFFDLVFVFALNQVSLRLIKDFRSGNQMLVSEAVTTFLMFLALWLLWAAAAALTSRLHPESPPVQIIVFIEMACAVLMAVAAVQGPEGRLLVFVGAYVAARVARPLVLLVFRLWVNAPVVLAIVVGAVLWIAGALVDDVPVRGLLWTLAVAVDYGGYVFGFQGWAGGRIAGEHLAERLQQFFLITLGEAIFVSGRALSNSSFGIPHAAAFGLAFVSIVLFWRVYFYRAGSILPLAITRARNPVREALAVAGSHLFMIMGVFLAGVGFELFIVEPLARPEPQWLVVILGGPALFLVGRAPFELQVFGRISRSRLAGLLALGLLIPAIWHLPPLAAGVAVAVVLAGIAVSDAWRARGREPEQPMPQI